MKRFVVSGLVGAALFLPAGSASAHMLPMAACNQGTENAHGQIPAGSPAHEAVPTEHLGIHCLHKGF